MIDHAYAHRIQRLMVMGLFALLLGVRPYDVHRWHLYMYADAIDWVSLPNVLGMSQYGDGGIIGVKTVCRVGQLHRQNGRILRQLHLRSQKADRRKGLSLYHTLLGFPFEKPKTLEKKSKDGFAVSQLGP